MTERTYAALRRIFTGMVIGLLFIGLFHSTRTAQAAVIFTQLSATAGDTQVLIRWSTSSEINTNGFYVLAGANAAGPFNRTSPFIPRVGTSISGGNYEFLHSGLVNGTAVYYRLEIINSDLTSIFTGVISATPNPPTPTPTFTHSPTATHTATLTLTPTYTLTVTQTFTPSVTGTLTTTATITRTASITTTRTYTLEPTATRRPATAIPTRTLIRIVTATPSQTGIPSTSFPSTPGGNYPGRGDSPTPTVLTTLTTPPPLLTPNEGQGNYPGGDSGDGSPTAEGTGGGDYTQQGTPVPFNTPTPGLPGENQDATGWLGWLAGILIGLAVLGGIGWYFWRRRKPGEAAETNLFKDDPEE